MKTFFYLLILLLALYASHCPAKPVHDSFTAYDTQRERPLKMDVWFAQGVPCAARFCLPDGTSGLVLLSHGTMGAAMEYNWLAYALASKGFVVVGLNHFGESWAYGQQNIDPGAILNVSLRPQDAHFALDVLSKNADSQGNALFNQVLNTKDTTLIGHSAGGATALMLAGARPDAQLAWRYCKDAVHSADHSCRYIDKMPEPTHAMQLAPQSDGRITRVIALDPAMGHAMTVNSLASIQIPVLVIGSVNNDFLIYQQHAGKYAHYISNSTLVGLDNNEGHFVYLDTCSNPHKAAGVSLCKDREGVDRDQVHQQLYGPIFSWLYSHQGRVN